MAIYIKFGGKITNNAGDLIGKRVEENRCPICGKEITVVDGNNYVRGYKILQDKNLFLIGHNIKICDTHILEI